MESLLKKLDELLSGKTSLTIKISFGLQQESLTQHEKSAEKKFAKAPEEIAETRKSPAKGSAPVKEFDSTLGTVKPNPENTGEQSIKPKLEEQAPATEEDIAGASNLPTLADDEEYCVACKGSGKNSKGGICIVCRGTGKKKIETKITEKQSEKKVEKKAEKEEPKATTKDDDWDF